MFSIVEVPKIVTDAVFPDNSDTGFACGVLGTTCIEVDSGLRSSRRLLKPKWICDMRRFSGAHHVREEAPFLVTVPDQNLKKMCRNEWWRKKHIVDDTGILGDEFEAMMLSYASYGVCGDVDLIATKNIVKTRETAAVTAKITQHLILQMRRLWVETLCDSGKNG